MSEIAIRVQDPSGTVSRDVLIRIEEPGSVRDLIETLVEVMEWPRDTFGGDQVVYRLRTLGTEKALDESTPAAALQLKQGDVLVLGQVR